jgi:hypothetical protein
MIKLNNILRESIDQHKRKVYLKAAIDMATAYSRRGYTQDEAIKDAAKGIENVYGYVLTPQDIEAVKHYVPINPQFKEAEDFDLSDNPLAGVNWDDEFRALEDVEDDYPEWQELFSEIAEKATEYLQKRKASRELVELVNSLTEWRHAAPHLMEQILEEFPNFSPGLMEELKKYYSFSGRVRDLDEEEDFDLSDNPVPLKRPRKITARLKKRDWIDSDAPFEIDVRDFNNWLQAKHNTNWEDMCERYNNEMYWLNSSIESYVEDRYGYWNEKSSADKINWNEIEARNRWFRVLSLKLKK